MPSRSWGVARSGLVQCLRSAGVLNIVAVAKYAFQAEAARRFGAREAIALEERTDVVAGVMRATQGVGVDQAYECVGGETDTLDLAIALCRPGGTAVRLGVFTSRRPIDLAACHKKEAHILSANSYATAPNGKREFQIALDMLHGGQADHKTLITHSFAPEDFRTAIDLSIGKGRAHLLKAVFVRP